MRCFGFVVLLAVTACSPSPRDPDGDGDGVAASADCDDADATVAPGQREACDGKDNDCDGQLDEGCDCVPGSQPVVCGVAGACRQACTAEGRLTTCLPPGASSIELSSDPANCGACGNVCPAATPACVAAVCTGPVQTDGGAAHRGSTSSGAALGSQTQTNALFTHVGVLGDGAPQQSNSNYRHSGGFTSGLR